MISRDQLATKIQAVGFSCLQCSTCCREIEENSNLVMVMPDEIRVIMDNTGLSWHEIVDPFPYPICSGSCRYTIGWTLKRKGMSCCFLNDHTCQVYSNRPWICRTYPFMLDDDNLVIAPCPGIGTKISLNHAYTIAEALLMRKQIEEYEEAQITNVLSTMILQENELVIIDSDGIKSSSGAVVTPFL